MPWSSILPPYLSTVEVWVVRVFLFLALITIGPWLALIAYDFLLYVWRSVTYNIPFIGGRARGRQRPRAPSLTERPGGFRRSFSFSGQLPGALQNLDNIVMGTGTSTPDDGQSTRRRFNSTS